MATAILRFINGFLNTSCICGRFDGFAANIDLIKSHTLADIAELQWRLSLPIAVLVLTLLGVAMSRVKPRSSQFSKVLPGVLMVLLYYNALIYAKTQMTLNVIFSYAGLWSVHVIFIILAIILIDIQNGKSIGVQVIK